MRIVYFKNKKGQWYFRIVAKNNKIVAQSEGYKTRQGVLKTIKLIINGTFPDAVELKTEVKK